MCAAAVGRGSCVKLTGSDTVTAVLLTFGVRRRVSSTFTRRRISAAFTNKTFRRCYVYMSVCLLLTLSDYAVEHFLIFSFDFSPLTFVRQLQFSDTTNSMSVLAGLRAHQIAKNAHAGSRELTVTVRYAIKQCGFSQENTPPLYYRCCLI